MLNAVGLEVPVRARLPPAARGALLKLEALEGISAEIDLPHHPLSFGP